METAIRNLEEAANALKTGAVKTGNISNKIPLFKTDDAQSMLNPQMVAVKTQSQAALNTVLRATLGAQFTAEEGVRVLNQVWDDKATPAANYKKLRNKIMELKANVKNAEGEFKRFGYMAKDAPSGANSGPGTPSTVKVGSKDMSLEQARKFYESHPQFKPDTATAKLLGLEP